MNGNVVTSTIDSVTNLGIGETWGFSAPIMGVTGQYTYQITSIESFK